MPAPLVPCVRCERHVRCTEAECPFCHAELEPNPAFTASSPEARLGSLAVMTFRAIALGAALAACGSADDDGDDKGAGGARAGGARAGGGSAAHPDDIAGNSSGGRGGGPTLGGATFGGSPADGGQVSIYRATPKG